MFLYLVIKQQMKELNISEEQLADMLKESRIGIKTLLNDLHNTNKYKHLEALMYVLGCFKFSDKKIEEAMQQEFKRLYDIKQKSLSDINQDKYAYV